MKTNDNLESETKALIEVCNDTLITVYAIDNNITAMIYYAYDSVNNEDFILIRDYITNIKAQYKILCKFPIRNRALDYLRTFYKLMQIYSNLSNKFYQFITNGNAIKENANKEDTLKHVDFDEDNEK